MSYLPLMYQLKTRHKTMIDNSTYFLLSFTYWEDIPKIGNKWKSQLQKSLKINTELN
jgi:hypothetical protein